MFVFVEDDDDDDDDDEIGEVDVDAEDDDGGDDNAEEDVGDFFSLLLLPSVSLAKFPFPLLVI